MYQASASHYGEVQYSVPVTYQTIDGQVQHLAPQLAQPHPYPQGYLGTAPPPASLAPAAHPHYYPPFPAPVEGQPGVVQGVDPLTGLPVLGPLAVPSLSGAPTSSAAVAQHAAQHAAHAAQQQALGAVPPQVLGTQPPPMQVLHPPQLAPGQLDMNGHGAVAGAYVSAASHPPPPHWASEVALPAHPQPQPAQLLLQSRANNPAAPPPCEAPRLPQSLVQSVPEASAPPPPAEPPRLLQYAPPQPPMSSPRLSKNVMLALQQAAAAEPSSHPPTSIAGGDAGRVLRHSPPPGPAPALGGISVAGPAGMIPPPPIASPKASATMLRPAAPVASAPGLSPSSLQGVADATAAAAEPGGPPPAGEAR